ncbi:FAD-dependent oxidoreductase [Erythrobacter sp. F6033]|nr:FAD-dependent oxidoreductase [Erythrobacter sp. F6033]
MCSAYALARRGWHVTLVDRASGPAMETSHSNGAQLSYCYTDALGSPQVTASLPSLLRGRGGVSFRLSARPDYACWLAKFAANCTASKHRRNTMAVFDLAAQSRRAMDALCEAYDLDFAHRAAGKIHLLFSDKDLDHARSMARLKSAAGAEQHILERQELPQLDPALSALDRDAIGAISTPSEMVGDPLLFSRGLLEILTTQFAAETRFDTAVASIKDEGVSALISLVGGEVLTADLVVVAAANESRRLLQPTGSKITLQPMKGYSFEMPITEGSPRISVTDGKRRLVFTNLGDRMRVAGIAELGSASREIDPARIGWLVNAARECLPNGGDYSRADNFWTGLRPVTPNSQPIIRKASNTIAINTGHGALGWTLAMGSGERLANLVEAKP